MDEERKGVSVQWLQLTSRPPSPLYLCTFLQATLASLIHQHFTATFSSLKVQPLHDVTPLLLLCSNFDADTYLHLQTYARQLAADVTAVGNWLGHLTECTHHTISASHAAGCIAGAADGRCDCGGLVVMDIAAARTVMLKMAGATLG